MKKHTLVALMAFLTFSVATITGCKKEKETTACISTTTTTFNTGQSVAFTSCSKESGTYTWQFGDGTTSSLENPTHVYTSSGTYEVVLTVSGPNGTDSTSKTVSITHTADNYVGTYSTTESCTMGSDAYTSSVTKVNDNTITINNFYGSGWSVTGTVADGILTIASQTVGGSNGAVSASGSGTLSATGNTLTYTVTLSDGTNTDACTVTNIKQ